MQTHSAPHLLPARRLLASAGTALPARRLLASASSALTTYIALAIIFFSLMVLTITCCVLNGSCGRCMRKQEEHVDAEEDKDIDLTSVLSESSAHFSRHSFSASIASSPGRMARAMAREHNCGSMASSLGDSGPLPASPHWSGKLSSKDPLDLTPSKAVSGGKKARSTMGLLMPLRSSSGMNGMRRPGGLPTIPSVTSMGSVTRSDVSEAAQGGGLSNLVMLTDQSITNSHIGDRQADNVQSSESQFVLGTVGSDSDARTSHTMPRAAREVLAGLEMRGGSRPGSPSEERAPAGRRVHRSWAKASDSVDTPTRDSRGGSGR